MVLQTPLRTEVSTQRQGAGGLPAVSLAIEIRIVALIRCTYGTFVHKYYDAYSNPDPNGPRRRRHARALSQRPSSTS